MVKTDHTEEIEFNVVFVISLAGLSYSSSSNLLGHPALGDNVACLHVVGDVDGRGEMLGRDTLNTKG